MASLFATSLAQLSISNPINLKMKYCPWLNNEYSKQSTQPLWYFSSRWGSAPCGSVRTPSSPFRWTHLCFPALSLLPPTAVITHQVLGHTAPQDIFPFSLWPFPLTNTQTCCRAFGCLDFLLRLISSYHPNRQAESKCWSAGRQDKLAAGNTRQACSREIWASRRNSTVKKVLK